MSLFRIGDRVVFWIKYANVDVSVEERGEIVQFEPNNPSVVLVELPTQFVWKLVDNIQFESPTVALSRVTG
jgi:hypothetical protein